MTLESAMAQAAADVSYSVESHIASLQFNRPER
jgi:hypothetical protein